jgi:hypothetical protein
VRAREHAKENASLAAEKSALFQEVRLLQERLGKLDQFKRAIMQSINENDVPGATRSLAFGAAGSGASGEFGALHSY